MAEINPIYKGLLDRGMPQHIALAFMDSFMGESGLNTTINEVSPMVEGSRGGRGLYQLTGPRRVDYENRYGTDYDVDSQLDYLMHELSGPEKRAAEAIYSAENREDAVRAITSKFLRPAKDNSDARIGLWGGQEVTGTTGPTVENAAYADRTKQNNPLIDFARDMNGAASYVTGIMPELNDEFNQSVEMGVNLIRNPRGASSVMESVQRQNMLPPEQGPQLPNGQPMLQGAPTPAPDFHPPAVSSAAPAAAPAAVSTSGGGAAPTNEAQAPQGFVDKALSALMPNRDPSERRDKASDILFGLSTGLGQMSAGQAVNMSPVMARIQNRQAQAAQSQQDAIKNQIAEEQLRVQQANAVTAQAKAGLDAAKFQAEQSGYSFDDAFLEQVAANPATAPLVNMMGPDQPVEIRKKATEALIDLQKEQGKAAVKSLNDQTPQLGTLVQALRNGDDDTVTELLNKGGVDGSVLGKAMDLAGVGTTADILNSKAYKDAVKKDPELAAAIERKWKLTNPNFSDPEQRFNFDFANEKKQEFRDSVNFSRKLDYTLDKVTDSTLAIMANPDANDAGVMSNLFTTVYSAVNSVAPETAQYLAGEFGIDVTNEELIQSGAAQLALQIARPLMQGQGTVTEGERRELLKLVASPNISPETRLMVVEELKTLNAIERIAGQRYNDKLAEVGDYTNAQTAYDDVSGMAADVTSRLANAARNAPQFRHGDLSKNFGNSVEAMQDNPFYMHDAMGTELTQAEYNAYKDALPVIETPNGLVRVWSLRDPVTGVSQRMLDINGVSQPYNPKEVE